MNLYTAIGLFVAAVALAITWYFWKTSASKKDVEEIKMILVGNDKYIAPSTATMPTSTVPTNDEKNALKHNQRGMILGEQGKHDEAEEEFRAAIKVKPDCAYAHYNLGITFGKGCKSEEAKKEYREAISIKGDFAAAYNNLGFEFDVKNDFVEAKKAYIRAIEIEPNYLTALYNLANLLDNQNNREEARKYWEKVMGVETNCQDKERIIKRLAEKD